MNRIQNFRCKSGSHNYFYRLLPYNQAYIASVHKLLFVRSMFNYCYRQRLVTIYNQMLLATVHEPLLARRSFNYFYCFRVSLIIPFPFQSDNPRV